MSNPKSPYSIPLRAVMTRRDWINIAGVATLGAVTVICRVLQVIL